MMIGENVLDIKSSWTKQADDRLSDTNKFDAWFDNASSEKETVANGTIDFYHRIFTSDLYEYIGDPRQKTCLEVGFGAGRLLDAALNVFSYGYGIDVLSEKAINVVGSRLSKKHENSFSLVNSSNIDQITSNSVNFVYSFIVFQHFDGIDEVKKYFDLFKRVMKQGAVGKIFYMSGSETSLRLNEFSNNPRAETLLVSKNDIEQIVIEHSMSVLQHRHAGPKKVWDPTGMNSSQTIISFQKV